MKLWRHTANLSEGKYLVVRRDGTVPHWPHFVLGAMDPCAPAVLRAYADEAERRGLERDYVQSIRDEAQNFEAYRRVAEYARGAKRGDPDAGPHRQDNPTVLAMMRGEFSLASFIRLFIAMTRLVAECTTKGDPDETERTMAALEQTAKRIVKESLN